MSVGFADIEAAAQRLAAPAFAEADSAKPGHGRGRATLPPMRFASFYFTFFWFSHRSAAGEAST